MTFEVRVLTGAELPPRLRDLAEPPAAVRVVGELPRGPAVAIVGTRRPSADGVAYARRLAREVAECGAVVLSGGAAGIDAAAHHGAMDAGAPTVVVAPSSFDRPYPPHHAGLFEEIVRRGGAHLCAQGPGTPARRHLFFERNSLLAALCEVLVVVETRHRGGARNAAKAARTLGRTVMAVPGGPWCATALGCLLEVQLGARLVTGPGDVLDALGLPRRPGGRPRRRSGTGPRRGPGPADPDRERILAILENGPRSPDDLCAETGLRPEVVQALLLTLTLETVVVSGPSGRVSLATH